MTQTPPTPTGEDATAPVTISVSIELDVQPDEVWPDGDIPKGWTAADVMALILAKRSFRHFLEDWDIDTFGADVTVHARGGFVNGHLQ